MFILFLSLALSFFTLANDWTINKDHSEIQFKVDYLSLSEVSGRFKDFSGTLQLDDQEIPRAITLRVATNSIDSGNNLRDGHLKSNNFFQSKKFPHIVFMSHRIIYLRPGTFRAFGALSIRQITKPFSLDFSLTKTLKDTWGYDNKFVKFESHLNRQEFNMTWNKTLVENKYLLGDVVKFWGIFQLQPIFSKTPSNKHMIPDTGYIRSREQMVRTSKTAMTEETFEKISEIKILPEKKQSSPIPIQKVILDFRDSSLWWFSLGIIGLMGFFAVIIIAFYAKKMFLDHFPVYEESSLIGLVSDLAVILIVIIYSLALWFVGWGIR